MSEFNRKDIYVQGSIAHYSPKNKFCMSSTVEPKWATSSKGEILTFLYFLYFCSIWSSIIWKDSRRKRLWCCSCVVIAVILWRGQLKALGHGQYLVLLCSRGQRVDLWAQLNKHLRNGPNPVVESSVLIIFSTEVVLVLLTLLQCSYGAVFSKSINTKIK